jgi:hypothetical protein
MPAVTVENPLTLPRITRPSTTESVARRVATAITAHRQLEGAGFEVRLVARRQHPRRTY